MRHPSSSCKKTKHQFCGPQGAIIISAFVACRLIALDKCPVVAFTLKEDIQDAAGQVCAGHISGCEAAVHAVYDSQPTEAVILVDAFNSLNREAALRNIQQLCPSLSKIIINTYREESQLFIDGNTLHSQEGTTTR